MKEYLDLVSNVLMIGSRKPSRTSVDTISTFSQHYNVDLRRGFPLLTTKAISWKNIVIENLWFLSGDHNIEFLHKHGVHFWDAWADEDKEVPSAYGYRWRDFGGCVDQVGAALDTLSRTPFSRRAVVSAWNPIYDTTSKLPPCHYTFALNVQELPDTMSGEFKKHLCIHVTQRSADIAIGVPYNIAGYALLCEVFAGILKMPAGILGHTLIDAHIYTAKPDGSQAEYDHVPGLKLQLSREPRPLPKIKIDPVFNSLTELDEFIEHASTEDIMNRFQLTGYVPHPEIKFKVAV